jgi:alkylation response protein AidB-like acyl-CoA dehydrogenase
MPVETPETVLDRVRELAGGFAAQRAERQGRRHLDRADFEALAGSGYLRLAVPTGMGGLFESFASSTRGTAEVLRALAHGDPSVALVASMHPAVLSFWLAVEDAPDPGDGPAWTDQRDVVFRSALDGHWWGTITSEPGTGGDIARTRATATPTGEPLQYHLAGDKHFGSGSGITSFVITTARPEGEDAPAVFFVDMRDRPWDGSEGVELTAAWDGFGMRATQSHAMRFTGVPATRMAARLDAGTVLLTTSASTLTLFVAVILGVVETALAEARTRLQPRAESLRAFEQVEWSRAVTEAWLVEQAYEGAVRAVETSPFALPEVLRAKAGAAELAEQCLTRLSRVVGGATFSESSPFGHWTQDVRALGFLRPPWGYAYDSLFLTSWS